MKRTTISLSEDLAALVEREAERLQVSVSHVVRTALENALRPAGGREIPWAGLVREPKLVYGADLDEALTEDWATGQAEERSVRSEVAEPEEIDSDAVARHRR